MNDGLDPLHALPVAAADLAVGGVLVQYVSAPIGLFLVMIGVLVLLTVAYRAMRRSDGTRPRERHAA